MRNYTVIQRLASAIQARLNCIASNNVEWRDRHEETIKGLEALLPHGSGIDGRREIDLDKSNGDRVIIHLEYHHMDDGGYYAGWTEHTITVRPSFDGIALTISGRDRNQIKEYLADTFDHALTSEAPAEYQPKGSVAS